jgi:MFS family permease
VVTVCALVQLCAGVGFYAVIAHLVVHLRHDLGLLATITSAVLATRTVVQYTLHLPAGALTDRLGPATTGALSCAVRSAGFALLAVATSTPTLVTAAILIGAGGSGYLPASQALLAPLSGDWPQRGFAWYTAASQLSAVAGPAIGLALLTGATNDGFDMIAWLAAASWLGAAALFASLATATQRTTTQRTTTQRPTTTLDRRTSTLATALKDPALSRLAIAASPVTLLITEGAVVVPLIVERSGPVTAFLVTGAIAGALVQLPPCRRVAMRHGLTTGFGGLALAYLLLTVIIPLESTALLVISGIVYGTAQGILLPSLFWYTMRLAPVGTIGTQVGIRNFLAGLLALAGGLTVGFAFDAGRSAALGAVLGLSLLGAVAATACIHWLSRFGDIRTRYPSGAAAR